MTDKLLEQILVKLTALEQGQQDIKANMQNMKTDMQNMKTDIHAMNKRLANVESDVTEIKETVNKNYDKTLEFYAKQMENNTEMRDRIRVIFGELEMHSEQISRNTADIRLYK